jgi:hypothetical protein
MSSIRAIGAVAEEGVVRRVAMAYVRLDSKIDSGRIEVLCLGRPADPP